MSTKKLISLMLVCALLLTTGIFAYAENNSLKTTEANGVKLFNIKETSGRNIDLKITAVIDNAEDVKLYYRNNFDKGFKQTGFETKYSDNYYVAMIPAFDTDADYIEYYISANILGKETKTNILTVNLVDMSIDPLEGIDDGTGEGEVSITASSPTRYFNDIAANDGYFAGVDLDNKAFDLAIPEKGRSTWPAVNSKWNQPRSEGTNPHKGLDLDIRTGKTIVPMLNGVVFYVQKNAGDNNYVAVQYDLHGSNHSGSADMIVYYFHINPKDGLTQGASVTAGQTELGTVNSLNHLHISMRDFSDLDLPQYYFFKDAPGMDAGYRVDLVHGPQYSGRTVTFRGYVYDQGGSAPLQSVYINYVDDNNRSRRAQMTRSGDYYSYTFPSDFSGCPVAYYLELYRSGLPYDMKAFSPAYYNIYYDGSQYVSTRPPWSACYDYLVP